jgi:hypothetical protein
MMKLTKAQMKVWTKERQDVIELLEAIGLENTTTLITAANNNLRFLDPVTGAYYYLNEKRGSYYRRPEWGSACAPLLNRKKTERVYADNPRTGHSWVYPRVTFIMDHDLKSQACRVAKIAIGYRKYKAK